MIQPSRPWRFVDRCPACGDGAFDAVGGEATAFRCDGQAAFDHPSYSVRACRTCALHYKSNVLSDAGLADYYEALDFAPFEGDYGFPTDAALLKRLRGLPSGARVLDYGCSTGRVLADLGPTYQRFGVEINEAAAQKARSRGITILPDAALDDEGTGLFDAVILADVFEHLLAPTDTLRRLAARLSPGGLLLIVTGLADAVRPRELMAEYWYMRIPGHLQMISKNHIGWLAFTLGLSIGCIDTISHYRAALAQRILQEVKAVLYSAIRLQASSLKAAVITATPGLRRAAHWTNLPATDQNTDHVLVSLLKAKVN